MTRLQGVSIADFKRTIETMREVYPFEDRYTEIIETYDPCYCAHNVLTIRTLNVEKDVYVTLHSEVKHKDEGVE